jgi:hypothetical protein
VFSIHFVAFPKLAKYVLEPFVHEHVGTIKCRTVELEWPPLLSHSTGLLLKVVGLVKDDDACSLESPKPLQVHALVDADLV